MMKWLIAKKREIRKDDNGNAKIRVLLLVYFKEFETKLRVMRTKMNIKDNRDIFFSATLTPTNRFFMSSAKK